MKLYRFFKEKPYTLLSAYWFIQILWYQIALKVSIFGNEVIMIPFNSIDNLIPFCEWFIIPYVLWYPFILCVNVYLARKGEKQEYMYLALMTIIGMVICMGGNTIFPTEIIRDENLIENLGRSNILTKFTAFIYSCDNPPRLVFPSMHVYGSVVLAAAMLKCKAAKLWMNIASVTLSVLICLSTMFIKQHSVIDFASALLLFTVLHIGYILVLKIKDRKSLKEKGVR
ncbi:MAG: hypothetical protein II987_03180 [Clostridia bacterium]|nr:hypothetical protein [Clostridia bacterium]